MEVRRGQAGARAGVGWGCRDKPRPRRLGLPGVRAPPHTRTRPPPPPAPPTKPTRPPSPPPSLYTQPQQPEEAALPNEWASDPWGLRAERVLAANARGPGCFDFGAYVAGSPDLEPLARAPAALWEHFLVLGQFQGRAHRWAHARVLPLIACLFRFAPGPRWLPACLPPSPPRPRAPARLPAHASLPRARPPPPPPLAAGSAPCAWATPTAWLTKRPGGRAALTLAPTLEPTPTWRARGCTPPPSFLGTGCSMASSRGGAAGAQCACVRARVRACVCEREGGGLATVWPV